MPAFLWHPSLFFGGIALASIPLLIHLFSRRRVRKRQWGAMRWLLAAAKRHQRRLRLEHWLMLLLRMTAVALLGLALARPVLEDSALAGLVGESRSVYVLIDASASTEAKVGARSVFERIQQEATQLLDGLGPDDAVAVVLTNDPDPTGEAGDGPWVLAARSVGYEAATRAKERLATARPRHAPAPWSEALAMLGRQMAPEDAQREVFILTDFQAVDWAATGSSSAGRAPALAALETLARTPARVRLVDLGGSERRNLSIANVALLGERNPFAGRPARLEVVVSNHGSKPVQGATLEVRSLREGFRRLLPVPPLAAADPGLRLPEPTSARVFVDVPATVLALAGPTALSLEVQPPRDDADADVLGMDGTRIFAFDTRPRIEVLGWTSTSRSELHETAEDYLRGVYEGDMPSGAGESAAGELPWFFSFEGAAHETDFARRLAERGSRRVDVVVLGNVAPRDPRTVAELVAFVREGGGLIAFAGDRLEEPARWNEPFHEVPAERRLMPWRVGAPQERDRTADEGSAFGLDLEAQDDPHPLAVPFIGDAALLWFGQRPPRIHGRMPFVVPAAGPEAGTRPTSSAPAATDASTGNVVLRFADGAPAVVAGTLGEGRTVWVATSVDNGWLGEAVFFRPVFLQEAAMWTAGLVGWRRSIEVGARLEARVPRLASQVRLSAPGGRQIVPTVREAEDGSIWKSVESSGLGLAGSWTLGYTVPSNDGVATVVEEPVAVALRPAESMLLPAQADELRASMPEGLDVEVVRELGVADSAVDETRRGEITRVLLFVLLILLAGESLLGLAFGRARSRAPAARGEHVA